MSRKHGVDRNVAPASECGLTCLTRPAFLQNPRKWVAESIASLQEIDQATIVTYVEMSRQFGTTDTRSVSGIWVKPSPV